MRRPCKWTWKRRARAEAAERILIGARQELHEKQAASRALERQLHQASQAAQARDQASAALEKELAGARTQVEELEGSRKKLLENSTAVVKALRAKDAALHKAEQKIDGLEGRAAEFAKAAQSQRDSLEGKIAALLSQLETERSARSFSEGALRSARSDRQSVHRDAKGEVEAAATPPSETAANKNDARVETVQPAEPAKEAGSREHHRERIATLAVAGRAGPEPGESIN
jgi:chromosome segregation ATPase